MALADGSTIDLEGSPGGGIVGWISPLGVPTADKIYYNDWHKLLEVDPYESYSEQGINTGEPLATPSIRTIDLATGEDALFARGAYSVAASATGSLAYVETDTTDVLVNTPVTGKLMVSVGGEPPERWGDEGTTLIAAAWAGSILLAYQTDGAGSIHLLAWSGPKDYRDLGPGTLVAVSPDGSRVVMSDAASSGLWLVDVASAELLDQVPLAEMDGDSDAEVMTAIGYGGDWYGNSVVAEFSHGFVVLDVSDMEMEPRLVAKIGDGELTLPPHEFRFVAGDEGQLTAWVPRETGRKSDVQRTNFPLSCDVAARTCTIGQEVESGLYMAVRNPSRPLGSRG
ncbi:MAG: hypothetical protein ACSLEW_10280 [Nocardioides sp.]